MVVLARNGTQSAELTLHPANLGPLQVSIQLDGQQASLVLSAAHESTRAALQEALPQLHAMFEQSGLQLHSAQVGDGTLAGGGRDPQQGRGAPADGRFGNASPDGLTAETGSAAPVAQRLGLVDTFA